MQNFSRLSIGIGGTTSLISPCSHLAALPLEYPFLPFTCAQAELQHKQKPPVQGSRNPALARGSAVHLFWNLLAYQALGL